MLNIEESPSDKKFNEEVDIVFEELKKVLNLQKKVQRKRKKSGFYSKPTFAYPIIATFN